jgi:hypothetical protein
MLLPLHQNAGQNHDIKVGNRCFENVLLFKYWKDSKKSKYYSGGNSEELEFSNACYYSA